MIIPAHTPVEIHTSNGGFARGYTWGKTVVLQAADGLSVCGSVTLCRFPSGRDTVECGQSISAARIERFEILDAS